MKFSNLAAAVAVGLAPVGADAAVAIYEGQGPDAESIQRVVDDFRDALGPNNGNAPVSGDPFGRRQINWDAAPDGISDPNPFPGDFFNADVNPRARGIEFRETGSTTGFQLSSTEASGEPPLFGNEQNFQAFSPERVFTPVGGTTFDVLFFDPVDQTTPATTRGLGIVFVDVEVEGSTTVDFFDKDDNLLLSRDVLVAGNQGLSFLGVVFDSFEIARVSVTSGNAIFDGTSFRGRDGVVMDDFIFGEPVPADPVPVPAAAALFPLGALIIARRRRNKR
ncbi:MAG: PEP-CTERM sorting domain-containing protein [Pseudomonadota bacterium]